MEKHDALPSLQEVLASLLWFLGSSAPLCCSPRDRAVAQRQLRFVVRHRDTDPLLREVAGQLLVQLDNAPGIRCPSERKTPGQVLHAVEKGGRLRFRTRSGADQH